MNHSRGKAFTTGGQGEVLVYRAEDGRARISVRMAEGTVWLTQRLMSDLFQVGVATINHHIKGIYEDGELAPEATIRRYRIVQSEGGRSVERMVDHYRLEILEAQGEAEVIHQLEAATKARKERKKE